MVLGWYLVATGTRVRSITLLADGRHVLSDVWTSAGVVTGLVLVRLTGIAVARPARRRGRRDQPGGNRLAAGAPGGGRPARRGGQRAAGRPRARVRREPVSRRSSACTGCARSAPAASPTSTRTSSCPSTGRSSAPTRPPTRSPTASSPPARWTARSSSTPIPAVARCAPSATVEGCPVRVEPFSGRPPLTLEEATATDETFWRGSPSPAVPAVAVVARGLLTARAASPDRRADHEPHHRPPRARRAGVGHDGPRRGRTGERRAIPSASSPGVCCRCARRTRRRDRPRRASSPSRTRRRRCSPCRCARSSARSTRSGSIARRRACCIGSARDLLERFAGRVPSDLDALLSLHGVGRKTANLVVTFAFGLPGICVDTHVHRISNRLGFVRTRTPEQTEHALRRRLPAASLDRPERPARVVRTEPLPADVAALLALSGAPLLPAHRRAARALTPLPASAGRAAGTS